jgi:aminoglycoside phosphotransferase (APT) family kinase protein
VDSLAGFTSRPLWSTTPSWLHATIEARFGDVVSVDDVHGGMSPGPAAMLTAAGGDRLFVKAVAGTVSPPTRAFYLNEVAALRVLPPSVPAPRLLHVIDDGDWIALVLSQVPGTPAGPPWTDLGVDLTSAALSAMPVAPAGVPPIFDLLRDLDGWERLGEHADAWERRHAPWLAAAVADWPNWTAGQWVVHQDVRADNVIVDPVAGRATLVDWSFCCAGADWLDLARLAADVVCTGHADGPAVALAVAERILDGLPDPAWRFVAALAGMWRVRSTRPSDSAMPTMRAWQLDRAMSLRPLLDRWIHQRRLG